LGASLFTLFLLLFLFRFVYQYQKKAISFIKEKELLKAQFEQVLLQSQVEVQELTYRQIAKELHDNVGQLLSTTKMLMGITEIKLGEIPEPLQTANDTLGKAIQEIRSLSRSLDRDWLQQFNFLDNIGTEIERINVGGQISAIIDCNVIIDKKPEEQIILFRIVQEAIQNAIRHGQPNKIYIFVIRDKELIIEIRNNGKRLADNFDGMGTRNMRFRTKLLGGKIQWNTNETETSVIVTLPLKSE